ncbi:MAG TPA: SDR family oxidoreductase [Bryobacteraceae bacterium]|nr:SDR family oxidoreductase [Bryobacteraceae bacterium]
MSSRFDLSGRVAVVIGGTSGIGLAIARGLEEHGARSVAAGRRSPDWPVDVADRSKVDALRDRVLAEFGSVDILVNAAGYTFRQPTESVCDEQWRGLIDTDLTGALRACQSFHAALKNSGRGRVINIASLSSHVAFLEVAAYCAAKTGLLSLTRSLAVEWARDGICVNAIAPGLFPTELNSPLILGTPRGAELLQRTPMARFGKPEELIGAAILLASDACSFLTGQCITVDGGFLASGVNQ